MSANVLRIIGIVAAALIVIGVIIFFILRNREPDEPETSVKPETKEESRILWEFDHHPGYSDMNGGYHRESLKHDKETGKWVIVCEYREDFESDDITTVYAVSDEAVEEFERFIEKKKVRKLVNRKDSDEFVTDYSAWSYNIVYTDPEGTYSSRKEYRIEQYKKYSDADHKLINELYEQFKKLFGEKISETREKRD